MVEAYFMTKGLIGVSKLKYYWMGATRQPNPSQLTSQNAENQPWFLLTGAYLSMFAPSNNEDEAPQYKPYSHCEPAALAAGQPERWHGPSAAALHAPASRAGDVRPPPPQGARPCSSRAGCGGTRPATPATPATACWRTSSTGGRGGRRLSALWMAAGVAADRAQPRASQAPAAKLPPPPPPPPRRRQYTYYKSDCWFSSPIGCAGDFASYPDINVNSGYTNPLTTAPGLPATDQLGVPWVWIPWACSLSAPSICEWVAAAAGRKALGPGSRLLARTASALHLAAEPLRRLNPLPTPSTSIAAAGSPSKAHARHHRRRRQCPRALPSPPGRQIVSRAPCKDSDKLHPGTCNPNFVI
jgi:hypothetical protein